MKKFWLLLLVTTLLCQGVALSDSAVLLSVQVDEAAVTGLGLDADSEALLRFLARLTLRIDEQEDLTRGRLMVDGESIVDCTYRLTETGLTFTTSLLPDLCLTVKGELDSLGSAVEVLQRHSDVLEKAFMGWAADLTPKFFWGSFASSVFEGGACRARYELDDRDMALLGERVADALGELEETENAKTILQIFHRWNMEAARSRRFTYLLDLIYNESRETLLGATLQVLDGNALAWSLSATSRDGGEYGLRAVLSLPAYDRILYLELQVPADWSELKLDLYQTATGTSFARAREEEDALIMKSTVSFSAEGLKYIMCTETTVYAQETPIHIREMDEITEEGLTGRLWYGDGTDPVLSITLRDTEPEPVPAQSWKYSVDIMQLDEDPDALEAYEAALEAGSTALAWKLFSLLPSELLVLLMGD